MKINKKTLGIGAITLVLGGVASGFVVYADKSNIDRNNFEKLSFKSDFNESVFNYSSLSDAQFEEIAQFKVDMLKTKLNYEISKDNRVLDLLEYEEFNTTKSDSLQTSIDELATLVTELENLDIDASQREDFLDAFFDIKEKSGEIDFQISNILRESIDAVDNSEYFMGELGRDFNVGRGFHDEDRSMWFSDDVIESIDETIYAKFSSGEITRKEALDLIKIKLDAMSDDQRKSLFESIGITIPENNLNKGRFGGERERGRN